ncbi:uncharacterized protein [Pleurodeles waltl]
MISDSIKEEDYPMPDEGILSPAGDELTVVMLSDNIKEEEEAYPMADQDPEEVKTFHRPAAEEFTIAMASDRIKEEGEDYPVAAENQGEVINVHIPFGEELSIATKSDDIKEEDTYPMVDQDPEEVKNIYSCASGPGPAATPSTCVGETDTHQPSDTNTSGSLHMSTVRRRPRALPLPEFSGDSDEHLEGPSTPSAPDRRSQILEGRGHPTPVPCRIATESRAQHHEAGEGPSLFGGLEAAMLQQQRLQNKRIISLDRNLRVHNQHMMGLHRQLYALNENILQLHEGQVQASEDTRDLTSAVRDLCQELRQERVRRRRQEHRFQTMFGRYCRSSNRMANSTALIARRAVAAQVEAAHSSREVVQGLVHITNVIEHIMGQRSASPSEVALGDTEDSSSLSSVAVPAADTRRRSARHSTATEGDNRSASGVRGRKK